MAANSKIGLRLLCGIEYTAEVQFQEIMSIRVAYLRKWLARTRACIIDQYIEPPKLLHRFGYCRRHLFWLCDIGWLKNCLAAFLRNRFCRLPSALSVDLGYGNVRPGLR